VKFAGISLAEAVSLATLQPARLPGLEEDMLNMNENSQVNLILFEWNDATCEIDLMATILKGQMVYQKEVRTIYGRD
ncbi:MAG: hypothetical protein OXU23_04155, partial [Candidatus Poribacteria bacterium]|nr:hypothetical protein [Candidatus Poribacteria bacterium]